MLNIIFFNLFKTIKDFGLLGVFMSFFIFKGWWIIARILGFAVLCIVFTVFMSLCQKDFKHFGAFGVFEQVYSIGFYVFAIGHIMNFYDGSNDYRIYYVSVIMIILGLIGKIIFTKLNEIV
ncbi:hypothetical protein AVANS14531_07150 [Campylobacter sp. Cr9]|uniref:hypothetical protein n=1 Tax=Campylobacter sp. Cr9 TaxID=2735728 RepID=UPI00301577AD|nr:hypothetical protein [Campylobacter sp. Cr9]